VKIYENYLEKKDQDLVVFLFFFFVGIGDRCSLCEHLNVFG